MRVAILTNNVMPPREGIGRHIVEIAKRLPAAGIRPVVLAKGGRDWRRSYLDGIEIRHMPWPGVAPFHQMMARRMLERWIADGADQADMLHVHLPLLPSFSTSLPTIVTVHSPMATDTAAIAEPGLLPMAIRANARLFSRGYEQHWLDKAHAIIAVSAGVRDELVAHYALGGREPAIVPNGVDWSFYASGPDRRPEDMILYVGRLAWRKGLGRLLEAFALLGRKDHRLVFLGEGPLRADLEARATRLGIKDQVTFVGFGPPEIVRRWLKRARLFVNPADYESGPLTLLEAMAAGTPVVSTRTGLVAEFGPEPPLLVAEQDPRSLTDRLAEAIDDPRACEERADAACVLVRASFTWDGAAERLAGLYRRAERMAA